MVKAPANFTHPKAHAKRIEATVTLAEKNIRANQRRQ
jgi:hypothetical protein